MFCDPAKMHIACGTRGARKTVIKALRAFRAHYKAKPHVYNSALMLVPDELRDELHAEALKVAPAAQRCPGWAPGLPCVYSQKRVGQPAMADNGGQCLFCSESRMADACSTAKGRANVAKALKSFRAHYAKHTHVYNSAILKVPEALRDKLHKEALKPKRAPVRGLRAEEQSDAAAETWRGALSRRKRAFKELSSKQVTAYKKRRTADRARAEKKFFLDNELPPPAAKDLAENDAGLPPASLSERAAFVETWCKREMRLAAAAPAGAFGRAARGSCHHHSQGLQAVPRQPLGGPAERHPHAAAEAVGEDGPEAAPAGDRRGPGQEGQQRLPHQVRHDAPALVRAACGGQDGQGRGEPFSLSRPARSARAGSATSSRGPTTT